MRSRATDFPAMPVEIDAYLQAILDSVALPVWVVDHSGSVLLANPAALAAIGYELSELVGRNGHETVHYKHPDGSPYPAEDCPVLQPIRTGEPLHNDEDWFVRRDGTMFPVSYSVVPIDLPTGRGIVMTFTDMTAQRQAEQSLRERDAILAQVAQPVWVIDHRGRFRYANPAAVAAVGYDDVSELVGRDGHETVHYKYPDGAPFPERGLPADARARGGREPARARGLAGAQGRLDPADRLLDRAVRPAGRPRLGHRLHRHRGAPAGRAGRARARRRRRAGGGAQRLAPAHDRGGRRRARPAHPRPPRRRPAAVRQRAADPPAGGAQGAHRSRSRPGGCARPRWS